VVWKTLTSAELIDRWLMPNDRWSGRGSRFASSRCATGDGVVHCEVLEVVPNRRLVYSWKRWIAD
jgi:uncharacterized protein YndB with AHSA1/START domain